MKGTPDRLNVNGKKGRDNPALLHFGPLLGSLKGDRIIGEVFKAAGGRGVYLVGGVLRNLALGRPHGADYDFVAASGVEGMAVGLARSLGATAFVLDKAGPSYRVTVKDGAWTVDLSPLKAGEITEDLLARDFTVNALAVELGGLLGGAPEVIDPSGGLRDAGLRLLRATGPGVFPADPLRCLRAVRLSERYGLKIDAGTAGLIRKDAALVKGVSAERVRDELVEIFTWPGTAGALSMLNALGLLDVVFPEFAGWTDIGGGYDLFAHTLKVVAEAEGLLTDVFDGAGLVQGDCLEEHYAGRIGAVGRGAVLKLAAFLHDAGKPLTIGLRSGRLRFLGHEYEGGVRVKWVLKRLKMSRKAMGVICLLVDNHHRVFSYAMLEGPSERARAHLFRAMGGAPGVDLVMLSLADARATRGGDDPALRRVAAELLKYYFTVYSRRKTRPLITGAEVMGEFGLPEGRLIGAALKEVASGVEEGRLKTRRQAIEHLRGWLERTGRL